MGWIICAILCCGISVCASAQCAPQVTIEQGILKGKWVKSHSGRSIASFEGVPYAKPPLGKYRFKDPQEMEPWLGVWDATKLGSVCSQIDRYVNTTDNLIGEEDCLFINIFTTSLDEDEHLPVVVYFHGGGFMFGSGDETRPTFLLEKDIVLVSVNYRLGVFGFLSTQDDVVPGNLGLKDQTFVLLWIQKNIRKFGGDPGSVTLTGLSAGGASVQYHYLSPLSQGTFHRGISWSGTTLSPWAFAVDPLKKAYILADAIGCPKATTELMVECFRRRPAKKLLEATKVFDYWTENWFSVFKPVIEPKGNNAFLNKLPYEGVSNGEFSQLPWITTLVSEEGLYPAAALASEDTLAELEADWEYLAAYIFIYNETLPKSLHAETAKKIKDFYVNGAKISMETFPQLVKALGDRHLIRDGVKTAMLVAQKSTQPVFFYRYSFRGPQSFSNFMSGTTNNYGVSHGDDVYNIFTAPYLNPAFNEETLAMNEFLVNLVYTFATGGIPKTGTIAWEPVIGDKALKYLDIQTPENYSMQTSATLGNEKFWKTIPFKENENAI